MNIPVQHLSVRIPWHDSAWNGSVCDNPKENGSCMFLPRINKSKDSDREECIAGTMLHELEQVDLPPCVAEKVHFMSPHSIYKKVDHPYSKNFNNSKFYGHYKETTLCYPGYSFSVVPYNWMLKNAQDDTSTIATELKLDYDFNKEPALGFDNSWIQQVDNQRSLLDTFINPIKPHHSLVFIYAKNIPYVDSSSRVLIGVGHVNSIGELTEYEYEGDTDIPFRSTLWERPVFHTIRDDFSDGFLLPYHDFFEQVEKDSSIPVNDYIAFAPSFEEFSYGSEWVSNDTAIESLLILHEKLKRFESILSSKNYEKQYKWIESELSKLWKMRGPFPGLGAVLSGLNVPSGNLLAWELDKLIRDDSTEEVIKSPWDFIKNLFDGETSVLSEKYPLSQTIRATWNNFSNEEIEFLKLLSRMHLTNEQVEKIIDINEVEQKEILKNPYLLYERFRLSEIIFSPLLIDKAIFSDKKTLVNFPLSKYTDIVSPDDQRRLRALTVYLLEAAALAGDTFLTDSQLVTKLDELPIQPLCNPSIRNLLAISEFLKDEVDKYILDEDTKSYYFKLQRLVEVKKKISDFVIKRIKRSFDPSIELDWHKLLNQKLDSIDRASPVWYQKKEDAARVEKADALNVLANNRFSVLIGPAGTGKTTLLKVLCEQDFIRSGSLLMLAPTGKARVKMGKDAKTLGQFLISSKRYNPKTGKYLLNSKAEAKQYDTVIVDESSMLTEEQLAALIDSLVGVKRFILVGDYRQLPPIGSGRPFVDIIDFLKQHDKAFCELKVIFRQYANDKIPKDEIDRLDIRLAKWFSSDDIQKNEVDIFDEIVETPRMESENIEFIEWHNVKDLESKIIEVTNSEIENLLERTEGKVLWNNNVANFDASLGSTVHYEESNWSGYGIASAQDIENWQVVSPMKTAGYGTKVLNQQIQKVFRGKIKEKAIFPGKYKKRKMNKPIADDQIVYSDKVINTKNISLNKPWNKVFNPKKINEAEVLKYIANGEIGLHIGKYGDWTGSSRPVNIVFSSQPDYAYIFNESDFKEDGDIQLELAYAITVHKSQGSGFNTVIFILPNPCPVLSRELFYTALTRQEDRIVVLHQGDIKDFRKYTSDEYSETARRLTDLFNKPELKIVNNKYYDSKYIQVSEKGEFMISKSEVIIADKLYNNQIPYVYESAIKDDRGITIHPDFTIEDSDSGIIYYWEHLGMLTDDNYRSKWKRKQEWYDRSGVEEYTKNSNADKQLIITRDKPDGGIDSSEIKEILEELFL